MSYKFGKKSLEQLNTCHKDLQTIFNEVIKYIDCTIIEGVRTKERQKELYEADPPATTTMNSRHFANKDGVSMAVDAASFPIKWNDDGKNYMFAGFVLCISMKLKEEGKITHDLRLGSDWDGDLETKDQKFNDLVHFELK